MSSATFLTIFCVSFLLCISFVTSDSLSSIQCLDRGFSLDNLLCSNCHDLKQFKLNEFENTCQECCTHTDNEEEKGIKYRRAVLTFCTCKFGRYPQIEAFIKGDRPQRFPTFSFKHVPGAEPVLHLYNDNDDKVQSLGIEKWDTDTLTAFLDENLQILTQWWIHREISIVVDNNDQIRLLTNLREDLRILLGAHSKGIWFRMLPQVFYMHFNRDIHLDLFAITNPLLFLDYISDMIKFDLPENLNEEDFIIELNNDQKETLSMPMRAMKREILFEMLQNASLEKRGAILRDICIIDEHGEEASSSPKIPAHEQIALRLQKARSMIDFCLRYLLTTPNEISDKELIELYENSNEFICNMTPLTQRLSSSTN